ncbi:MAG: cell division protein FtsZ [Alphaproteobacteria bacterium]|jgi:cell division protein FtsZ|nr:cell division protein FtsZ [Alphaproteobacteria bacterium]
MSVVDAKKLEPTTPSNQTEAKIASIKQARTQTTSAPAPTSLPFPQQSTLQGANPMPTISELAEQLKQVSGHPSQGAATTPPPAKKEQPSSAASTSSHAVADAELKPRISVIGVGGAGNNAVNNMIRSKLQGVRFIACNTDAQALTHSLAETRLQLGTLVTQGLGAGSKPEVGRAAAEESLETLMEAISGSNMLFITAGMGGGSGTGAAPVVAQAARALGILTVAVVTKPFHFEGNHRMRTAEKGIEELAQHVDTLIIIPNQNLFRVANEKTTFADAFKMADDVLYSGVRGVTDLMMMPGLINLDFADIRSVMSEMGKAMMGTGEASGDERAISAAEAAISNPLLDDVSMRGAQGVLINITGGLDMTLFEVDAAANRVREEVDPDANIIFGSTFDEKLSGIIRVSVVATGIEAEQARRRMMAEASSYASPQPQSAQQSMVQEMSSSPVVTPETTHASPSYQEPAPQSKDSEYLEDMTEDAFEKARQEFAHYFQDNPNYAAPPQARTPLPTPATPAKKKGFFSSLMASMRGDHGAEEEASVMTALPKALQNVAEVRSTQPFPQTGAGADAPATEVPQDLQDVPTYVRRRDK